jgi:hypothetical protein
MLVSTMKNHPEGELLELLSLLRMREENNEANIPF